LLNPFGEDDDNFEINSLIDSLLKVPPLTPYLCLSLCISLSARVCLSVCLAYSITERRVPELIPVLGSQPAGDVSYKPGGRLPLLSARAAVTFPAHRPVPGVNSLPETVTRQRRGCDLNPGHTDPESSTLTTPLSYRASLLDASLNSVRCLRRRGATTSRYYVVLECNLQQSGRLHQGTKCTNNCSVPRPLSHFALVTGCHG